MVQRRPVTDVHPPAEPTRHHLHATRHRGNHRADGHQRGRAPNAYGPPGKDALDFELNAHVGAKASGRIVGYLTEDDDGRTPVVQGPLDPCPGYYVSTTAYSDRANPRRTDPRRYVNAAEINYVVRARVACNAGVRLGDFCVVHSLRTRFTVYAIVGDSGNSKGAEGSLALLQRLGYPAKNGKAGGVDEPEIVVRYFASSNPEARFFFNQSELETAAREPSLDLDTDFSAFRPGERGTLVLDAIAVTGSEPRVLRVLPFAPLGDGTALPIYPGRLLRLDSEESSVVEQVQRRLRDLGYLQPGPRGGLVPLTGNKLETIEGNTNDGGSRDGIGVFRRTGRTIASINRGFINYS